MMMKKGLMAGLGLILGMIFAGPSAVYAGLVPLGGEFQINTTTEGSQSGFSVGTDDAGNFVAVWRTPGEVVNCDGYDLYFQLFDTDGNKVGGEVQVPQINQEAPQAANVAMDADGDFVVVWPEGSVAAILPCFPTTPDGDGTGIVARRYFSDGSPNGGPVVVNTTWESGQYDPVVAMNGPGDFMVVWRDNINDGDGDGVYAQLFDSSGNKVGSEQLVNQTTAGDQWDFDVSINDSREWIVVWRSNDSDSYGVFARRFSSDGTPAENEWIINTDETGAQFDPVVELFNDSSFVIAWSEVDNDGDIYFQRFSSSGTRIGSETLAHSITTGPQRSPHIKGNKNTKIFFIIWLFNDSDPYGVQGRLFLSSGVPAVFISKINTTELGSQTGIDIAFNTSNKILISWISNDGDLGGGFGQRYQITAGPLVPMVSPPLLVLTGIILMMILIWAVRKRKIVLN